MNSKRFVLLGLMLVIATGTAAHARQLPQAIEYGGGLKTFCSADKKTDQYAMCFAFVSAVLEVAGNNSIYGQRICVFPPWVPVRRAVELTENWLRTHRGATIEPASLAVAKALSAAYPCNHRRS